MNRKAAISQQINRYRLLLKQSNNPPAKREIVHRIACLESEAASITINDLQAHVSDVAA